MASEESNASVVQRYSTDLESFDIGDTKVQHFGLLMKKPFGHKSTRWQKRWATEPRVEIKSSMSCGM